MQNQKPPDEAVPNRELDAAISKEQGVSRRLFAHVAPEEESHEGDMAQKELPRLFMRMKPERAIAGSGPRQEPKTGIEMSPKPGNPSRLFIPVDPEGKSYERKLAEEPQPKAVRQKEQVENRRLFVHVEPTKETVVKGGLPQATPERGSSTLGDEGTQKPRIPMKDEASDSDGVEFAGPGYKSANFELELFSIEDEVGDSSKQKYYKFIIKMRHGRFIAKVKATEFEKIGWVKEATDGRAFFRNRKDGADFSSYVHEVIERDIDMVGTEVHFTANGWKDIGGRMAYVTDSGAIGNVTGYIRGDSTLKFQFDDRISPQDNFGQFLDMEKICRTPGIPRMLMLFANMSVMTSLYERAGVPIKFIMGIMGTTNTLKTSMAVVFTRTFNALGTHSPEITFSSTRAGIETYVARYADAILLVDDFMPGEDKAKQAELNSKLELLCRLYGDRASKKRMTVFAGKDVEFPVRGCCMITGEHLTGVESSKTRMVCLGLERGDVDKGRLGFYQENPLVLPTYLQGFIKYLGRNPDRVIEKIKSKASEYRRGLPYHTARYNEAAAQFLVALDIVVDYWESAGFIEDPEEISRMWKDSILGIIAENDRAVNEASTACVILQALEEKINQEPQRVRHVGQIQKSDAGMIYYDEDFIYIPQRELFLITKEYCKKYSYNFYLQTNMVSGKLKEADILECRMNSAGHLESSRKLEQGKGITRRFLYIKKARMKEVLSDEQ